MSPVDFKLACRMIKASAVAYGIGQPGGIGASPYYKALNFQAAPKVFQAGTDNIDGCYVGTTADGVVLAFRGTLPLSFSSREALLKSLLDWLNDAEFDQVTAEGIPGRVHKGFTDSLLALWDRFLPDLKRQLAVRQPLIVTGHSKGASLATLAAVRLLNKENIRPKAVFTFASARTGDPAFAERYGTQLPQTWRFANRDDLVPHLPPSAKLVEVLEMLPGAMFKDLRKLPLYEHVDTLEFINWDGRIVGESLWLELERLAHLAKLLAELQIEQIAADHSSEGGYMKDTCRAGDSG